MNARFRFTVSALAVAAVLLSACGASSTPETIVVEVSPQGGGEVMVVTATPGQAPVAWLAGSAADEDATAEPVAEYYTAMPTASAEGSSPSADTPAGTPVPPDGEPYTDVRFDSAGVNPFVDTEDDRFSTFAVDVDTASYTVMRRYVDEGYLPPDESVRVEEYVNFFEQDYELPGEGAFAIHLEGSPSPFGGERYHLLRVGLQGYDVPADQRDDVVLTFVIDVSGSMEMENRLGLVKQALQLLVNQLRPTDRVGIVVYGSRARVVLEHAYVGEEHERILSAIGYLQSEGSTNAEEGLVTAYQLARQAFDSRALNRVILCSDGVANVGNTGPEAILAQIREYAGSGIYLTTVGFGMGNYNDTLMEQLANDGDGFYAYVDDIDQARRVFVHDLTATLQTIARDAKIQVEFNPSVVRAYRLIGYENRAVADSDFRVDTVDAGEIGAGHSVTALYEIEFADQAPELESAVTVYVRYQDPDTGQVTEVSRSISRAAFFPAFEHASPRFQLDAVVAEYAEILRGSYWAQGSSLDGVAWQARRVAEYLPSDPDVVEFAALVERASGLSR